MHARIRVHTYLRALIHSHPQFSHFSPRNRSHRDSTEAKPTHWKQTVFYLPQPLTGTSHPSSSCSNRCSGSDVTHVTHVTVVIGRSCRCSCLTQRTF